jgi:hypothetical protein
LNIPRCALECYNSLVSIWKRLTREQWNTLLFKFYLRNFSYSILNTFPTKTMHNYKVIHKSVSILVIMLMIVLTIIYGVWRQSCRGFLFVTDIALNQDSTRVQRRIRRLIHQISCLHRMSPMWSLTTQSVIAQNTAEFHCCSWSVE